MHILVADGCRDIDVIQALEDKNKGQGMLLNSLKARIKKVKEANK